MNESELLEVLEMNDWHDIQYCEQFLTLMEHWEEIDEDILIQVFSKMSAQECKPYIEYYFSDLMTGIPDDNLTLYKIFSSVKATLMEAANAIHKDSRALGNLAYELLRFQEWLMKGDFLVCSNASNEKIKKVSIFDALILFRIDQLNAGKFDIDFPDDLEYRIDEYEYDLDEDDKVSILDDEDFNDFQEEDEFNGLIDEKNPVIEEFE
ncbi:MAG: hypothetical protein MJA31_06265 [Clostridia bacterium]|nr:hypothetical protein [Clostridia bacterium]